MPSPLLLARAGLFATALGACATPTPGEKRADDAPGPPASHGGRVAPGAPSATAPEAVLSIVGEPRVRSAALLSAPPPIALERSALATLRLRAREPNSSWSLALDDHAPRTGTPLGLRVVDLIDEDREVAPGAHRLVAFRVRGTDVELDVHSFWVDVAPPGDRKDVAPGCLLAAPAGTYNGDARADSLVVLAVPLAERVEKTVIDWERVSRPFGERASIEAGKGALVQVAKPPSGDFRVSVVCSGADGSARTRVERVVTVNRDAPVPRSEGPR